ncbi:hypothetical protein AUR64_06280 [Haloprofundus marisrubri]|uniref:Uncharacterized protein n=1 Tax=Haloprofundus marisrubri TaxID=1514971 RepID=A0A0W1RBM4_9EURY|nr:hypothetical protein [Haloprofundus marisrubri]KTG10795.1 hypothetical protein AUR64_06280 [Haloprofundus marisrubri]
MATETATGLSSHMRGVTVTTLSCLAGIGAAVTSGIVVGTTIDDAANRLSLAVFGAFVLVQFPLLRLVGVDMDGFGAKDYLYVVFMTFALWFISYTVFLSTGVSF